MKKKYFRVFYQPRTIMRFDDSQRSLVVEVGEREVETYEDYIRDRIILSPDFGHVKQVDYIEETTAEEADGAISL
jgi:hypothetical protein